MLYLRFYQIASVTVSRNRRYMFTLSEAEEGQMKNYIKREDTR